MGYRKDYNIKQAFIHQIKRGLFILLVTTISWYIYPLVIDLPNTTDTKLPATLEGPYAVTKIVDGDTIWIENSVQQREKIRLIGIDTPEKNQDHYQAATDYTASILANQMVYIERGAERYDKYQRSLCYIYLDDQVTMVNEKILSAGWAKILTIPPNDKYEFRFKRTLDEAVKQHRGLYQILSK